MNGAPVNISLNILRHEYVTENLLTEESDSLKCLLVDRTQWIALFIRRISVTAAAYGRRSTLCEFHNISELHLKFWDSSKLHRPNSRGFQLISLFSVKALKAREEGKEEGTPCINNRRLAPLSSIATYQSIPLPRVATLYLLIGLRKFSLYSRGLKLLTSSSQVYSNNSSVSITMGSDMDGLVSTSDMCKSCYLLHSIQTGSGAHTVSYVMGKRTLSQG
jgi:hypothetical protein